MGGGDGNGSGGGYSDCAGGDSGFGGGSRGGGVSACECKGVSTTNALVLLSVVTAPTVAVVIEKSAMVDLFR